MDKKSIEANERAFEIPPPMNTYYIYLEDEGISISESRRKDKEYHEKVRANCKFEAIEKATGLTVTLWHEQCGI